MKINTISRLFSIFQQFFPIAEAIAPNGTLDTLRPLPPLPAR
jgi:hypothetical protein